MLIQSCRAVGPLRQDALISVGDFVDAAEKVNDDGARRGLFSHTFTGKPEGKQHPQPWAGICFEHKQNGTSTFLHLGVAQRTQNAVIDGIIQK